MVSLCIMTGSLRLKHYLESLDGLPSDLRRNMTLLTDLDERSSSLLTSVNTSITDFSLAQSDLSDERSREAFTSIESLYSRLLEFADDKVQLAIQTYEMVDKHVRRLDSDLARFQMEMWQHAAAHSDSAVGSGAANSTDTATGYNPHCDPKRKGKLVSGRKSRGGAVSTARGGRNSAAGSVKGPDGSSTSMKIVPNLNLSASATGVALISHPSDVLDMPVDPNEPTYCVCHQVSYGEMIGCDNLDCPIEWFHFSCVGLKDKPKGKWFCSQCG